ncbi:initiator Replication family protein [Acinetobacter baumannii 6112]|nr:initiator Replication family protein [Acinetobacter baumannii 6112]
MDVVPLITRLEKQFTSYQLKQVTQLTGKYAIRLYELLIAWREVGKTPIFEVSDFRSKLGLTSDDYPRLDTFKRRVLESAVKQINEHTDIIVKVTS